MIIDKPQAAQIPQLRALWTEAFGDTDDFLDVFFHRAYSADRCRCVTENGTVAAALYWFDCQWEGKQIAYLYAVATAKSQRGKGLCKALMENTHQHLRQAGYAGCILHPQSEGLFSMYGKLGYTTCSYVKEFSCVSSGDPVPLAQASPAEYAAVRRALLPANGVLQEGVTLDFLSTYARLYTGSNFALAAYPNKEELVVCELLGSPEKAPQILTTLGYAQGTFRVPGQETPFAMYLPLEKNPATPAYFGLALD